MKDDLMGCKIVLVTGSTDGIGKETALGIARMWARVLLHGRNAEKGRRVQKEIREKCFPSRIATVSSIAHRDAQVDSSNLQGERRFDGYDACSFSKLGNLLFTYELSRRLKGSGVDANALHPGVIRTKLLRAGGGKKGRKLRGSGGR